MRNCLQRFQTLFFFSCAALMMVGASGEIAASPEAAGQPANGITGTVKTGLTATTNGAGKGKASGALRSGQTGTVKNGAAGGEKINQPALSPYAEELAKIIKFDRKVLLIVKEEAQEHIQRLVGFDENGYQIIAPGIAVSVPEDKTDRILSELRRKLLPLQYMAFVVEMNEGLKSDKIGILKGSDQYEILRIMHTDGDEYGIANQDVIDRLREWEKMFSFDIIGADSDWVEIEFKTLPRDLKAFAEDVYEFSPDAVDQGPGTVEGLIREIKRTNKLFLWWD